MLEVQGNSVIFYAFYTEDGVGDTGLTVTVTVYEVIRDGTKTEIVSDAAVTEIGDGLYRYLLAAGSVDAAAEYVAVFHTADADTDQKDMPAMWVIDRANVEDIDDILTDTGTTIPGTITTIDNFLDTEIAAILEDTGTTLPAAITALEGKIDIVDSNVDSILEDTGTTLPAAISGISGGTGASANTYTVNDDSGNPLSGVLVKCSTDSSGANVVAQGTTNSLGQITLNLDSGVTYYLWKSKFEYEFTNPDVEVAV